MLHFRLIKLLLLCCVSCTIAEEHYVTFEVDDMAELQYKPDYTDKAFGETKINSQRSQHPWPFEALSIGHSMASFQSYRWNQAYFHHGIDIRGDEGTPIYAAVGGKVVNVANYYQGSRYYWEVAILDEQGYLWQYHHVDPDSIPEKIKTAFKNKESVPAGELLGEIVDWPASTYGEVYTHIHLNVLGKDGVYLNPLHFLESLQDKKKPSIQKIGILDKRGRPQSGNVAKGDYGLFVQARDLLKHHRFYIPPYHVEYRIQNSAWKTVWKFDQLPGGSDREAFVKDFFVPWSTCGNYTCREIYIDLGFQQTNPFPQKKGSYDLEVRVFDQAGNADQSSYQFEVR